MIRLLLLAVVLLASPAAAHLEPYSESQVIRLADDHSVFLSPQPAPLIAGKPFEWTAYVGQGAFSSPVAGVSVRVTVAKGPAAVNQSWPLVEMADAYRAPTDGLPANGTYNVSVRLESDGKTYVGAADIRVYQDVGATIVPENEAQDAYVNRSNRIAFLTVDAKSRPIDAFQDLRIRLQHWNDQHTILHDEEERALARAGAGQWTLDYAFPHRGMHHLSFASRSGSFGFNDTPLLHVYAVADPGDGEEERRVPLAGPAAVAAGAVAIAFARRRRA